MIGMDFPRHINKIKDSTEKSVLLRNYGYISPIIPVIVTNGYDENLKFFPPPLPLTSSSTNFSHMGAESYNWVLCYSDDIYKYWRHIEQNFMMSNRYPNMITVRPILINIVRDLQANYGLTNTTLHLAIHILDYFLSRNSEYIEMKLLVITALLLAAKVEDMDPRVPRFTELNRTMLNNAFSLIDYRRIEAKMLNCLNFSLTIPTVATFADFFSRISVVLDDFHIYQQIFDQFNSKPFRALLTVPDEGSLSAIFGTYDEMLSAVNQLLQRLVDYTLESESLLNVLPSRKAAACIAAARYLYNIQPVWTPFLELQSCYSEAEIRPIMEIIISIYDMNVSNQSSCGSSSTTDTTDNNDSNSIGGSPPRDENKRRRLCS